MKGLLESYGLSVGYTGIRKTVLLTGLEVSLRRGELVCLMGPNGIGKTTLLRTLSGLQPALEGKVTIAGKALNKMSLRERAAAMAVVLTDPVSTGMLSVRDVTALGRIPFTGWSGILTDHDHLVVEEALALTRIKGLEDKPLFELSDGQRQKVMIARALAQDCDLMIMDEPNAHLDLNNRVEIMKLLKKLTREKNKTVLMATHELDLALQMADRIWLIDQEKEMISGVPEDLVLKGVIDEAFTLKGFDLKTGSVIHQAYRNREVELKGDGYLYLWTRNALEREGYSIVSGAEVRVECLKEEENGYRWKIEDKAVHMATTIRECLEYIDSLSN